jgi:hypothetical protein
MIGQMKRKNTLIESAGCSRDLGFALAWHQAPDERAGGPSPRGRHAETGVAVP